MTATITVTGNLGQEPEPRTTSSGTPTLSFSVADTKRRRDQSGGWEDVWTTWYRVTLWQEAAELYTDRLHKGDRVVVTGRPHLREYQDRDGNTRQSLDIENAIVAIVPRQASSGGNTGGYDGDTPPF